MNTSKGVVISNSSPLIILSQVGKLDLLNQIFEKVCIPQEVFDEVVTRNRVEVQQERIKKATEDFIEIIKPTTELTFVRKMSLGEQEVLTLAVEKKPDYIILDDKRAINEAKDLNLKTTLTTEILRIAEEDDLIESYTDIMETLAKDGFFPPE